MAKPTNKIENLLNQIYDQIDLKQDIFDYVQPFILNAYALLRNDEVAKEQGNINSILFKDIEQKLAVENILYRDLPGIVDIYIKMPLEYRNEKLVKNNKTHRQLLIDNIEILCKKLKSVEHDAYSQFDQSMRVSSRLIRERYEDNNFVQLSESALELETQDSALSSPSNNLQDNFNWQSVKSTLPKLFMKDQMTPALADDNKKIVLNDSNIEYKVKDKHRHFMNGVYDAYSKFVKNIKPLLSKKRVNLEDSWDNFTHKVKRIDAETWVFGGMLAAAIIIPSGLGLHHLIHVVQSNPAKDIERVVQLTSTNEELRDFTVIALDKFNKENDINIQYTPDQGVMYAYRDMSKSQCVHSIQYLNKEHNYSSTKLNYYVNDKAIDSTENLSENVIEEICSLPESKLGVFVKRLK